VCSFDEQVSLSFGSYSLLTFVLIEQGFLCPICHTKFNDQTELAQHYTKVHAQEPITGSEDTHSTKNVTAQKEIQVEKE
jgi:predicted HNH restriction endonuclease